MGKKSRVTVGLAGCGRIVEEGHVPGYLACRESVKVVALADPSAARREKIGALMGIHPKARHADAASMFARERFDILVVATPPDVHAAVLQMAALNGVGIICEKPLCRSEQEARQLRRLFLEQGTFFAVLHNYLEQPGWRQLIQVVGKGEIGSPGLMIIKELARAPWATLSEEKVCWRTLQNRGGGPLWENLYHACYLSEAILESSVVRAYSSAGALVKPYPSGDTAMLDLEHANGSKFFALSTWGYTGHESASVEVVGSDGVIQYNYWEEPATLHITCGSQRRKIVVESPGAGEDWGYATAFQKAFEAFAKRRSPYHGIDEAVRMVLVLAAACRHGPGPVPTLAPDYPVPRMSTGARQ